MTYLLEDINLDSCPHRNTGLDDWYICMAHLATDEEDCPGVCLYDGNDEAKYAQCSIFQSYVKELEEKMKFVSLDCAEL